MLNKIIEFSLVEECLSDVAKVPEPSIKSLPDWYKKMPSYIGNNKEYHGSNVNSTLKKCIPVFDAIGAGYVIKTWTDVYFNNNSVSWSIDDINFRAVEGHSTQQAINYPISSYYNPNIFKWMNPWHIKTPKGYSTLFITPIGHSLPFKLIEGIVDTDTFPLSINFPFFIYDNFNGVIPYGTPMVQAIPFKRDSFKAKKMFLDQKKYKNIKNFHNKTFINRYKLNWWTRKEFK